MQPMVPLLRMEPNGAVRMSCAVAQHVLERRRRETLGRFLSRSDGADVGNVFGSTATHGVATATSSTSHCAVINTLKVLEDPVVNA
ncbi:hypothetical protein ACFWWT_14955 [Streptomyces sp. NPDC058676]|uniref:hypothetical protein n=1 Tax=unclassified Streptomyces TaxID=2593676 RepID=UPI00364EC152